MSHFVEIHFTEFYGYVSETSYMIKKKTTEYLQA